MGKDSGMLVLEKLEYAFTSNNYSQFSGFRVTDDAFHITSQDILGESSVNCIKNAIKDSGFSLHDIDYINPDASSSYLNDKNETLVFKKIFWDKIYKIPKLELFIQK